MDQGAKARRLRRWSWALAAAGIVVALAVAQAMEAYPYVVADAVQGVLWAALVLGVLAYFGARGEPEYRRARGPWFGALAFAVGIGPTLFVMQRAEHAREAEKVGAIVKSMAQKIVAADQEYAKRMEAAMKRSIGAVLASPAIAEVGARKQALVDLAAAVRVLDESLALRKSIAEDALREIQATRAPAGFKQRVTGELRAALAAPPPAVKTMTATRAFLAKADELIVHVDAHEGKFDLREGRLEFADGGAGARYGALHAELAALKENLKQP